MSLLERAYRITGDRRYLDAALRALAPLQTNVRDGGLLRCFGGDCRHPFFEEYPTHPASYVLNGFMFTLVGLHDLASVAPSSSAGADFQAGLRTLATVLPRYDYEGRPSYSLTQDTIPGIAPDWAPSYHPVDVYLLEALDSVSPHVVFGHYAVRWASTI